MADAALAHRRHGPIEVAAAADRGATVPSWLAGCLACLSLRADLLALASAAPTAAIPRRVRDLRLSPHDAARLRSRSRWRARAWIGTSRDRVSLALALGLTTMGLVGLLLARIPVPGSGLGGAAGAAPAVAPAPSALAALPRQPPPYAGAPSAGAVDIGPGTTGAEIRSTPTAADGGPATTPLTLFSVVVGGAGLAMFALRRVALRRGSIP